MSDIRLDFDTLETARRRADQALSTLQSAGRVSDDIAPLTGESRLASKVRDFADNWDIYRETLEEQLAFVRDSISTVMDVMTDLDVELADSLSQAAVEAAIDEAPK